MFYQDNFKAAAAAGCVVPEGVDDIKHGCIMAGSTSAVGFKWLDILEKEFDKSYVGLDHHLETVLNIMRDENPDDAVPAYEAQRKLLSNMAQCFVQVAPYFFRFCNHWRF